MCEFPLLFLNLSKCLPVPYSESTIETRSKSIIKTPERRLFPMKISEN